MLHLPNSLEVVQSSRLLIKLITYNQFIHISVTQNFPNPNVSSIMNHFDDIGILRIATFILFSKWFAPLTIFELR